ncbi:helix-turn-helix domain-containing protein [Aeromonas rivipollensis]
MLNYSYYPFKKDLENIDIEDLLLLKNVSEGWYIDYKVQGLKIIDFAKHISAFANQYGGWLIVGVNESSDGSRTAAEFVGITKSELEKVSRDIREASSAHINPEVLYEEKTIDGPLEEIGLAEGKSILIIGIPMSHNTPHIHSSGRIYRRLADQSKPKEETDRYILDDLWKRGNNKKNKITEFLTNIPTLPSSQSETTWAHIYFKPAQGQLGPSKRLSLADFSNIVRNTNKNIFGVHAPMQGINCTTDGFIARQIEGNDPSLATLTLRWWHNGVVRFDIPLNFFDFEGFIKTHDRNNYGHDYCKLAYQAGYSKIKIVDYSIFVPAVASLANCYLHMLKTTEDKRDIYSCFTLRNVFHTSPFVDSKKFIERASEYSIPLTIDQNIFVPQEPYENNMFFHENTIDSINFDSNEDYQPAPYTFSIPIVYQVFKAAGIVSNINDFFDDTEAWGFSKVNNILSNQ